MLLINPAIGGPLMNGHGGSDRTNTMILSNSNQSAGIGFAIPINTAKAVLNDLMTLGEQASSVGGAYCCHLPRTCGGDRPTRRLRIADYRGRTGSSADQAGLHAGRPSAPYLGNTSHHVETLLWR